MDTGLILQFLFFGAMEGSLMHWYKFSVRKDDSSEEEKTKASKYELWTIAFVLSLCLALAMMYSNDLNMGLWALIPYTVAMYALQYALSMKVIKKLLRKWSDV